MLEILAKGKRTDNGVWVQGYMAAHNLICEDYPEDVSDALGLYYGQVPYVGFVEVDPKTVVVYTGMTTYDKTKIFSGDICKFTVFDCWDNDKQYRGVVVYSGSRFMLWETCDNPGFGNSGGFDLDWVIEQDIEFRVVGNIYDGRQ